MSSLSMWKISLVPTRMTTTPTAKRRIRTVPVVDVKARDVQRRRGALWLSE
ncbi:hypothetical protein [Arthrobacter sp. FW306-2-2C-D06B]|uniref:hypothetical protein n=1 Tax=Arthrobacter sp. FW306-2-2C-D06B TaxID=2879618 RepID=UPI003FA4902A